MYTQAEQISQKSEGLWTQWRRKLKVTASQPCLSVVFTPAPPNSTNSWIIVLFFVFCFSAGGIYSTISSVELPFAFCHLSLSHAPFWELFRRWYKTKSSDRSPHSRPRIMILLFHIPHQWPYPHPFVSAAQNEADSGDASPVDQWAPVVKGCVLSLASLKRQSEIFVRREGEGRVEPVGVGGGGHVAPNEVSACHRASHQTAGRHAHFLNSTPRERKGRTCRKAVGDPPQAPLLCGNLSHLVMNPMLLRK